MAGISRRQLNKLRELASTLDGCRTCAGMFYIGAPGLFVVGNRPVRPGDKQTGGTHTKMSEEEFERFFNGCPDCGKDLKTYPIVMQGLGPRVEVPDPWPVNQWPPAPMKKHRRPVMER